jgi:L-lactate dehydrogenase complex protein LldG
MNGTRVLEDVRRALGRGRAAAAALPVPPQIDEHVVRLVQSEIGLPELLTQMARQNQMIVDAVRVDELAERLSKSLRARECHRIAVSSGGMLEGVVGPLKSGGFDVMRWGEISLDELYDLDAGVTDVRFAVAETGSLVIDGSRDHGRSLSLVPPVHVAVVERRCLLPDLVDLFARLAHDATRANTVIITGPSKTADIEMNLVTGVHGPGVVHVMLLDP